MHPRIVSGIGILIASALVAGLNFLALKYFLYWRVWWYDIPMHFIGGAVIAAIVLWFIAYEVPVGIRPRVNRFAVAFIVTLVVGVLWEVLEYAAGLTKGEAGFWADTFQDIAMDLAGALAAYLLLNRHGR